MPLSPRTRRVLKAVVITGVILIALAGALYFTFTRKFTPEPKLPAFAEPKDRAEAVRQDLQALALLTKYDNSFSDDALWKFAAGLQAMEAKAGELTPAQVEMGVSRLVALADNGHTTAGRRLRRLHRVPIRLAWFQEGLYVVRAAQPQANLVGSRVERINGRTPGELVAGFHPFIGGPDEHRKATSLIFLVSPTAFAGVWPEMPADSLTFDLVSQSGKRSSIVLASTAPNPETPYNFPARDIAPQPISTEGDGWVGVLSGMKELPLVLRDPDNSVFYRFMPDNGLYIHIVSTTDDDRGPLADQLERMIEPIAKHSLRYAILDMRGNGGGDYTKTLDFTRELPKRIAPDGRLFILTDNHTFSAAIVTTARVKHFAGARAAIYGERVGDRERFWAEAGSPIVLPNAKITVFFATGYHDWNTGCGWGDWWRCFWLNWAYGVPAGNLSPMQQMAWKWDDYRNGRDTVLEAALAAAKKN